MGDWHKYQCSTCKILIGVYGGIGGDDIPYRCPVCGTVNEGKKATGEWHEVS